MSDENKFMSEDDIIEFLMNEGMTRDEAILAMAHPTFPEPVCWTKEHELN
jgi:hypothetical protein